MLKRTSIYLSITLLGLTACAKKRSIEKLQSPTPRLTKNTLLDHSTWMYQATVVKTSAEAGPAFVGAALPLKLGFFEFSSQKLTFYSSISPNSELNSNNIPEYINSWDITHSEYRLASSDGQITHIEEEAPSQSWHEKSHFTVDWNTMGYEGFNFAPCWRQLSSEALQDQKGDEFSKDHVSFVIRHTFIAQQNCLSFAQRQRRAHSQNHTFHMDVRHSFAPYYPSNYEPMAYLNEFDPRRQKYGFFEQVVDRFNQDQGQYERFLLVNRFNPNASHKIYFSPDFPDTYKWIYNQTPITALNPEAPLGIIYQTNTLLEKAGIAMRFEIIDDPDVVFGDVRKSFIHFNTSFSGNLLGWGPSYTHPLTGEILRSVSVVFPSGLKNIIANIQKAEAEAAKSTSSLQSSLTQILKQHANLKSKYEWASTSTAIHANDSYQNALKNLIQKTTAAAPYDSAAIGHLPTAPAPIQDSLLDIFEQPLDTTPEPLAYHQGVLDIFTKVAPRSAHKVQPYIREALSHLNQQDHSTTATVPSHANTAYPLTASLASLDIDVLQHMNPDDIVDYMLYFTAIHEFGHNLGLRHNFYGSVDKQHFHSHIDNPQLRNRDGEIIENQAGGFFFYDEASSSVMDYIRVTEEAVSRLEWKAYDQAALLYSYSTATIDLSTHGFDEDNELTPLPTPKPFLYCTDEHAVIMNPFCNRHDKGTTASEIMVSKIKSYDRNYRLRNFRNNRTYWDGHNYARHAAQLMREPYNFLPFYAQLKSDNDWYNHLDPHNSLSSQIHAEAHHALTNDSRRAASLLAAFYLAVIQQTNVDRNIINVYDDFTGALQQIGIFHDKLYAVAHLGLSFEVPSSLNDKTTSSFLNFDTEGSELGLIVNQAFKAITSDNVAFVVDGFESLGRSFYLETATNSAYINSQAKKKIALRCYDESGLRKAFDLNPQDYYPGPYDSFPRIPGRRYAIEDLAVFKASDHSTDLEHPIYQIRDTHFAGKGQQAIAVVAINNNYYVASKELNPYSFALLSQRGETDSGKRQILGTKRGYDYAAFELQNQSCLSAHDVIQASP